jgi:hypothetical protein
MGNRIIIKWRIKKNVSTNDFYKKHWSGRKKMKDSIIFNLEKYDTIKISGEYEVYVRVNNRLDVDNNSAAIKVIIDHIKELKWIKDDNPKNFKKLTIESTDKIERNLMIVEVIEL